MAARGTHRTSTVQRPAGDTVWQDFALCREVDSELFFPPQGEAVSPAKRICRRCDVRTECLEYALGRSDAGVWGGLTAKERQRLKRTA